MLWYHRPISILHRPHCTLYTKFIKFDIDQLDFTYTLSIGLPLILHTAATHCIQKAFTIMYDKMHNFIHVKNTEQKKNTRSNRVFNDMSDVTLYCNTCLMRHRTGKE